MHFTHLLPVRAHRRFVGALALLAAGPGHANLLNNSSFEAGTFTPDANGVQRMAVQRLRSVAVGLRIPGLDHLAVIRARIQDRQRDHP